MIDEMKNKTAYIYMAFAAAALVTCSCEERHPDNFGEMNSVYFNNRSAGNVLLDSTEVTFVYEPLDETRMEIPVAVQLLGRAADYDRTVDISVSSDNAREGTDYILPESAILPAGEYSFDYVVTLVKTDALETEKKEILLTLHENENFTLALTQIEQTADTASTVTYRILFSDMFTSAPSAWDTSILGDFSQEKFELICKVLSIDPDDFNDDTLMTLPRQIYIREEIRAYISDEKEKMDNGEDFDEDILDAEGNVISL